MITVNGFENKFWTFPGGERSLKLTRNHPLDDLPFEMRMDFKSSDDLVDMILAVNALRHMFGQDTKIKLVVPYFPFGRQDRVMTDGESFGLQVAADAVVKFPDNYGVWATLATMTSATAEQKAEALAQMKRLDPLNPNLK
jgi:phosphoribosylpyrophosphate synthetase